MAVTVKSGEQHRVSPGKKKRRRRRRPRSNSAISDESSAGSRNTGAHLQLVEVPLVDQLKYVALDCEMVGIGRWGKQSALARVTIVDWNENVLYDEFVKPSQPVSDYRSYVSGISYTDLLTATVDLYLCRQQVLEILEGKILVGHALKNDLHALHLTHPWQNIRDTAKFEPFMKIRFDDGVLWPRKLKDLCHQRLNFRIQEPGIPHSAYEDACAALALYKSVRPKWEKAMQYKIEKTAEIEHQQFPLTPHPAMWPELSAVST